MLQPPLTVKQVRQGNMRARTPLGPMQRYTMTFERPRRGQLEFYFVADGGLRQAAEVIQRFLADRIWFEIPRPPGHDILMCRTAEVRDAEIKAGWPSGVDTWPAVQDVAIP